MSPDLRGDDRRLLWLAVVVTAAMAAFDWAAAVRALRHAPRVADLYHLVYPHDPRKRGESTITFLFAFPTAVTIGLASLLYRLRHGFEHRRPSSAGSTILSLFVMSCFTVGSISRAHATLTLFP